MESETTQKNEANKYLKIMKKQILFSAVCGLFFGNTMMAQNAIPNGNLENWSLATFELPQYYSFSSNENQFFDQPAQPFNITQTNDAQQGSFAVQLTTNNPSSNGDEGGFFSNINPNSDPSTWHGGIPYNQTPTGISGYYKYNVASADSGLIIVVFSNAGNNIGTYVFKVGGVQTTYTLFNFALNPALPIAPDSVGFAFASSDLLVSNGLAGSTLLLDNISLTGVASQPAEMNGDFELWELQTIIKPDSWFIDENGFSQTTDAFLGTYAIELTTYLGENNGVPRASAGQISTGYWDDACGCQKGGQPFTNQIDTLVFSYKYTPSGNDSADVGLNFKNNGSTVSGAGRRLGISPLYQTVEIPFNTFQPVDSVIFSVQSSVWQDSAVSFVGSSLIIDEIYFKSQPLTTGILNLNNSANISIYPNPTTGKITVTGKNISSLEIYNTLGEKVYVTTYNKNKTTSEINLSNQPKGIYFVKIKDGAKSHTRKIIVE